MELRHLRYFVAVAETLSFTRAAQRLHIGQPPLSMQIKDLEEEIGARLFERTKRRVVLTEAGKRFLDHACWILQRADQAMIDARLAGLGEIGQIRIGFTSSLPYSAMLPELLAAFRLENPDIELTLKEMFTADQFRALNEGELDVGLVRVEASSTPEGLTLREVGRDPLVIVMPATHHLSSARSVWLSELADEAFIGFPSGTGTGLPDLFRRLALNAGFEPRVVQTAREATTQIGLVAAGLGLALLPAPLSCVNIPRVRYVPLADADAQFPLSVAWLEREQSPVLGRFLGVLDKVCARCGGGV